MQLYSIAHISFLRILQMCLCYTCGPYLTQSVCPLTSAGKQNLSLFLFPPKGRKTSVGIHHPQNILRVALGIICFYVWNLEVTQLRHFLVQSTRHTLMRLCNGFQGGGSMGMKIMGSRERLAKNVWDQGAWGEYGKFGAADDQTKYYLGSRFRKGARSMDPPP